VEVIDRSGCPERLRSDANVEKGWNIICSGRQQYTILIRYKI
jgi:hypothetical protein